MEAFINHLTYHLDGLLILFYRVTGLPFIDYLIGTSVLAFLCVIIGEMSVSLALRFNSKYIDALNEEMNEKERLSIEAYGAGDKETYKALNKEATDAWGKHFFTMVAYAAGILWPIPFALGWMQGRFHGVDFPLAFPLSLIFGDSVGYTFSFIPLYILSRVLFKYMRPWLPFFKGIQRKLDQHHPKKDRQEAFLGHA